MPTQAEKAVTFQDLHYGDAAFVMPNPWDLGTTQMLAGMGAKALATSSAAFLSTIGGFDSSPDNTCEDAIEHARSIVEATDLPVSADLENGYGHSPEDVADTVKAAIDAGLAGCSIEDVTMDRENPVYDFDQAFARVKAGAEAARSVDFPFQFCARADGVMIRAYDMDEAVRRVKAFEEAGADVLYVPVVPDLDAQKVVCEAVSKPVNALAAGPLVKHSIADLSAIGVKRVSLGSSLFAAAMDGLVSTSQALLEEGDLSPIAAVRSYGKFHKLRKAGLT